jgi:prepilin-type N-terminal cleavage/methylation domain-containing protein
MRTVRRPARGFTLIEIMIVVMIIGIIASLAVPFYQRTAARAHRSEIPVVLGKLRQHFINQYNDNGTFYARPDGVDMAHNGAVSSWNPVGSDPGPGGTWALHAAGWGEVPFPPEGNIKLRYQYFIEASDKMTFYVCGVFPGYGAATLPCGKDPQIHGNYMYVQQLEGPLPLDEDEFPKPNF